MQESCPGCGSLNPPEQTLCGQCGTSLDNPPVPEPHRWMSDTAASAPPRKVAPQPPPPPQPRRSANLFPCPDCGRECSKSAAFCPQCGRPFAAQLPQKQQPQPPLVYQPPAPPQPFQPQPQHIHHYYPPPPAQQLWNPGVAGVLSFIFPGAGQLYKGQVGAGIIWFFVVIIGYAMLFFPGLLLHIICICTAASGNPYRRGG